jgi:hypothetical protein
VAAARFRCTTASSLLQRDRNSPDANEYEILSTTTDHFAGDIASSVLRHFGFLLRVDKASSAKAKDELLRCVRECIRVSTRIHAQWPYTRPVYLEELEQELFRMGCERMETHPAMRIKEDMDLEGEDKTAEEAGIIGRSPDLIVEPMILRSGDEKGESWSHERLVNRARVWICDSDAVGKVSKAVSRTLPNPILPATSKSHDTAGQTRDVSAFGQLHPISQY